MLKDSQKIIQSHQTPKRQRKFPLLTIKKSQKKSNAQSAKNKNFFSKKKIRKFKKPKFIKDDVSLETNSTTNTLEEENFITNAEVNQYLSEIEFVVKDICEKGFISMENLEKNFFEKIGNKEPKNEQDVKLIYKNSEFLLENINQQEKIKLILDIDETLVYSQVIEEININKNINNFSELNDIPQIKKIGQDEFYIKIDSDIDENNKKIFILKVQIRKGLALFFKKLTAFCDFYINTMASKSYVLIILKILEKDYDFFIKEEKVICTHPQSKKILDEKIKNEENFLILDDNICAWEMAYIPSIIPVKKFNEIKEINNIDIFYQYYLFSNKIYCFNETKSCFVNSEEKIPFCVEVTKNEKNSKNKLSQLNLIAEIIIKSFILKKILHFPIRHCLHFIQNTILKNCKIFYQGFEQNFISEMILLLGGTVINDINYIKEATHIIYNENLIINRENELKNNCNKYNINIKWIFDCFFKFKKCEENTDEYQI
jgi:hypothetical protein